MDGLIEALLSNPFLILIIIGGLVSLFKGKSDHPQQERQRPSRPIQTNPKPEKNTTVQHVDASHHDTMTVEEHRDEQMERLKQQLNTDEDQSLPHITDNKQSVPKVVHSHDHSYKYGQFKKDMKKNLTKQGLIDSIVMAEVLGPPRARKPYRSIIYERKKL